MAYAPAYLTASLISFYVGMKRKLYVVVRIVVYSNHDFKNRVYLDDHKIHDDVDQTKHDSP